MEILPILSSLRRHKITALLLVLEIALTCAIVSNAIFLINQRLELMHQPSGVAEHELVQVRPISLNRDQDEVARGKTDEDMLRQIPGVRAVGLLNQIPFGNSSWNSGIKLDPKQRQATLNATMYYGDNLINTLGLRLIAGRDFREDEYRLFKDVIADKAKEPATVIITRTLADKLWPGESALGKSIYFSDDPARVIGVVDSLVRPSDRGASAAQWSVILPMTVYGQLGASFMLRTDPKQRQAVLEQAVKKLKESDPRRVILNQRTWDDVRAEYFQSDRAMTGLLVAVIIALLLVTGLGIVGLGSFWVAQRRKQIGIRRAVGATRRNILRYFQTENFLLATIGIVLGMLLAFGLNLLLMQHYETPRLPWLYLPIGAVALWLIGQLAVLGPALRASRVPPVVATRTV
ncbi:MAG: FtsX-like permease family protein, partial [Rhodanobacteraceae bacterium]